MNRLHASFEHGVPEASVRLGRAHWPRAADLRVLIATALPMATMQVGLMAMGVVDTIMVGHFSAVDLAAVALGNLYVFGCCGFGIGMLMALDPVVAQAVGARDQPAVARGVQRGIVLALLVAVPTTLVFLPSGAILRLLGQPPEVVVRAAVFINLSALSIVPFFAWVVLRQSLQAMGHMRPIVTVIVAANLLNALLCWLFVFGHLGSIRGAAGAALASVIARWCMALGLLAAAWTDLKPALQPLRREALALGPLRSMVGLGAPIGAQMVLEFGIFGVVAVLMGRLGTVPIAAHQIAINIASLTFMVPLGISGAAAVLVGRSVGAGEADRARREAVAALGCGVAFMVLSGLVLGTLPRLLARVYTGDPGVIALAVLLIPIAGVFQVFDGLQVVSIGVLRGVGDTRAPMIVNVLGFWLIGFPVSLWLGFHTELGAPGLWWGFVAGLAAVALFLLVRVRARLSRGLTRLAIEEEPSPAAS
jgi:MATE family multidrug resistance protein